MKYESAKTEKGNVGVSYVSQELADEQARQMDTSGCFDCFDCVDCFDCYRCTGCTGCTGCYRCFGCTGCTGCSVCTGCTDCLDCSVCTRCTGCTLCFDCYRCSGCLDCSGCYRCTGCSGCSGCSGCTGCTRCTGCTGCSGCSGCSGCFDCLDCSGVLIWRGGACAKLLALNGLKWSVAVSESRMQIGCQNHTHEEWESFDDEKISSMSGGALEFWQQFKPTLMVMCAFKRGARECK